MKDKPPIKNISFPSQGNIDVSYPDLYFNINYYRTHGPYNPEHIPMSMLKIMRRDPVIALGYAVICSPIITANYEIKCENIKIQAFVQKIWDSIRFQLLSEALNALPFGFEAFEITWKLVEKFEFEYLKETENGWEKKTVVRKNCYIPDSINALRQEGCTFVFNETTKKFMGVKYTDEYNDKTFIDLERLWMFVYNEEYNDKRGNPMSLNVYQPWYNGNMTQLYSSRYLDKKSDPPLIGKATSNVVVESADGLKVDGVKYLAEQLTQLRAGGVAVLPGEYDENGNPLFSVDELTTADRMEGFLEHLNRHDIGKLRGMLIPEQAVIQSKQSGSYAQSEVHSGVQSSIYDAIMKMLCTSLNKYFFPKLTKWEFGVDAPQATIHPKGITSEAKRFYNSVIEKLLQIEPSKDYFGQRISELLDAVQLLKGAELPLNYDYLKISKKRQKEMEAQAASGQGTQNIPGEPRPTE